MRTTPRVILILKQASSATKRCETLAKKIAVTLTVSKKAPHAVYLCYVQHTFTLPYHQEEQLKLQGSAPEKLHAEHTQIAKNVKKIRRVSF